MEPTANELKNSASSAGQYAGDKAKQVASQVASQVSSKLEKGEKGAQEIYEMARERAEDALDISVDFVKRHPFATLAGAAAIGVVAGLLLRRRN